MEFQLIKPQMENKASQPLRADLQKLLNSLQASGEQPSYNCNECQDSGRIYLDELGQNGNQYRVMKHCVCRIEQLRQKRLEVIPPMFRSSVLSQIQPMEKVHPRQSEIIPAMKANPFGSYFLGGKTGYGKSMLMWALYREAVMNDKRVIACTLTELLDEYKRFIQLSMSNQTLIYPRLSASDLTQNHTKFSIFFDDIDKARPTEYAMEQLFELANAIYNYQHQIVITTNLTLAKLITHFEKADERFGGAIVRRLVSNAKICEMF